MDCLIRTLLRPQWCCERNAPKCHKQHAIVGETFVGVFERMHHIATALLLVDEMHRKCAHLSNAWRCLLVSSASRLPGLGCSTDL